MTEPVRLLATKSDAETAQEIHDRLLPILGQLCDICTDAARSGLHVNFNLAPDGMGISRVQSLTIVKKLLG